MTTVDGLPAHILLIHAVVVLVPLSALLIMLITIWPAARARLTVATAVLTVAMVISVPLATQAGEWLERRVNRTELVRAHTELGDSMLPWAIGLTVVALMVLARELLAARSRRHPVAVGGGPGTTRLAEGDRSDPAARWGGRGVSVALAVIAVVVAVGSVITVYRIGDSGARAAWTGQFTQQAQPRPGQGPPPG